MIGQNHLNHQTGEDLFLKEFLTKYCENEVANESSYFSIFYSSLRDDKEAVLTWMHNLSQRLSVPSWMSIISKYRWSSIYTSAIDDTVIRAFRTESRKVSRITSVKQNPIDQTNRKNLHCTYLYGSVLDTSEEDIPPFDVEDYDDRNADEAYPLLLRIHEKITPLGTLVIDCYDPDRDWLSPDILKRLVKKLIKGQTFLFSANNSIKENEYIKSLITEGKIVTFDEPLSVVLEAGQQLGELQLGKIPEDDDEAFFINIGEKIFSLPTTIWTRVSQFAEVLDSSKFAQPEALTQNEQEIEFQIFLAHSSKEPIWSDYYRKYPFVRDYQIELEHIVNTRMKMKEMDNCPIILHGQTGTGKTIALQQLAYNIGLNKHPVLYIDEIPSEIDRMRGSIDEFCEWAENNGSNKTLIVWDCMLPPENYQRFFNYLSNRGRKIVLVGSYYNLENRDDIVDMALNRDSYISAPVNLNDSEKERLSGHFSFLYPEITKIIKDYPILLNNNFFVYLYRLLPSTRGTLHRGIATEAEQAAEQIRRNAIKKKLSFGPSIIEKAFLDSGISIPQYSDEDFSETDFLENEDIFNKLIQYVMVPGRLDEDVPLNLLQRTIHSSDYIKLLEILENEDLFIINETNDGDFLVSARHPIEAKIICNWRFGGARDEIKHCLDLISNMYHIGGTRLDFDENAELRFVLNLVKKLGPNGPEKDRYMDYYHEISTKLAELRQDQSIFIPNLILQEANLSREYIRTRKGIPLPNTMEILDKAIYLLSSTILKLKRSKFNNIALIDQMMVELAAIKSTKLTHLLNHDVSSNILSDFDSIHRDLDEVLKKSVNDEHALDIYGWSTEHIIQKSSLSELEKNEILTKALTAIEIGETSAFGVNNRILDRKRNLYRLMGEKELSHEIFEELKKRGSRIGYLRLAIEAISKIPLDVASYNEEEISIYKENFDFLQKDRDFIKGDMGCLHQLLKSWWIMKTSRPIFRKENERQTVPFTRNDWLFCLGILEDMKALGGLLENASMMYLYGLALFHIGKYELSFPVFKSLSHQDFSTGGGGGRRIIRYYLASSETGSPIKYNGKIKSLSFEKNLGFVEVEEFRKPIRFFPRDFRDDSLKEGSQMDSFHIAFNFIGINADPTRYYKKYHVE